MRSLGSTSAGRVQGADVLVRARTTQLKVHAKAESESGGAVADADADALIDVDDEVEVSLAAGSSVMGDVVTITASHAGVDLKSRSDADTDGLYADANSTARVDYDSHNQVVAAGGSTVSARDIFVNSTQSVNRYDRHATADVDVFGSESTSEPGDFAARREIDWNGNVTFLGRPAPELLVDSNGLVVLADNVTVNGGLGVNATVTGGTITVDPIVNNDSGTATFSVDTVSDRDGKSRAGGRIQGRRRHLQQRVRLPVGRNHQQVEQAPGDQQHHARQRHGPT